MVVFVWTRMWFVCASWHVVETGGMRSADHCLSQRRGTCFRSQQECVQYTVQQTEVLWLIYARANGLGSTSVSVFVVNIYGYGYTTYVFRVFFISR